MSHTEAGLPNWAFEGMLKKGDLSLLDRSNWTSVVGEMYSSNKSKKDARDLAIRLVKNEKIIVTSLTTPIEEEVVKKALKVKGKILFLNTNTVKCEPKREILRLEKEIVDLGGTSLYPYTEKNTKDEKGRKLPIREVNKLHFQRIMESYLIRARLSDAIVHIGENKPTVSGLERFIIGYGQLLGKKVFNYDEGNFNEEVVADICHIYWDVEYKPLKKYIIRDKF